MQPYFVMVSTKSNFSVARVNLFSYKVVIFRSWIRALCSRSANRQVCSIFSVQCYYN